MPCQGELIKSLAINAFFCFCNFRSAERKNFFIRKPVRQEKRRIKNLTARPEAWWLYKFSFMQIDRITPPTPLKLRGELLFPHSLWVFWIFYFPLSLRGIEGVTRHVVLYLVVFPICKTSLALIRSITARRCYIRSWSWWTVAVPYSLGLRFSRIIGRQNYSKILLICRNPLFIRS